MAKNTGSSAKQYLPFEEQIAAFDRQIDELKHQDNSFQGANAPKIRELQVAQTELMKSVYSCLTPWQTVQVSRHPQRPILPDYLNLMFKEVRELHGDRSFGDDRAIVTAFGQIGRQKVLIVGQNKGRDIKEKVACNFGCPNPEGYRKALAKMKLAEKYGLPIVTLIDTPGAYPGIGAEERGQSQAIAVNLMEMSRLRTQIVCVVIGEGGSGGALAIGVGDALIMLQYSTYSVISPEGCASILWKSADKASLAAEALSITAPKLKTLGLVDQIVSEPLGGAHRDPDAMMESLRKVLSETLANLRERPLNALLNTRYARLMDYGKFKEARA
jgi:acetyl-CoA carboxylase carboxyl transferase subunit alpha